MDDRRRLSLFDLTCLGTNAIVGSGIYAFPGILALALGPASTLAFGACGLVAAVVGLCFAEVAGRFDRSGGPYLYARAAFGPWPGYLVGWTCWTAALLSWAAVASAIAPYLAHLWPAAGHGPLPVLLAVGLTLVLGGINVAGVKPGAYTINLFTVAKLVPLGVLLVAGLRALSPARLAPFAPHGLAPLPRAAFTAFFAFQGFEVVPVPAGESRDPARNAPRALLFALAATTLLYMAIQVAAVGATPGLAGSEQPLALMGTTLLGAAGGKMVAAAAVVSMVGFCSGVALAGPRYLQALADDGHVPGWLAARHPSLHTPHRAIVASTALTAALVAVLDFRRLVDLSVLTVGVQYLATCLALPVLRRRRPDLPHNGFRVPGGAALPVAATAVTLLFGAQADPKALLWFSVLLLAGVPVRWLGRERG